MHSLGIIVIYGKGRAMEAVCNLLNHLAITYYQMDDQDSNEHIIKKADILIVTPGIKPDHRLYKKYNKKILSELSFIAKLQTIGYFPWRDNMSIVCITGTNGKSTTTRALYQSCRLLEQKNKQSERKDVYIGGNFDTPLSGILLNIMENDKTNNQAIIILEASSFMLRHLEYMTFDIGVVLNIATDHIDWHGSMKDYVNAKLNALIHSRLAITLPELKKNALKSQIRGISRINKLRSTESATNSPQDWIEYTKLANFHHPFFLGAHNAWNFGAIEAVLQELYPNQYHRTIFQDVKPVAHRLQAIPLKGSIVLYDDSVSSSAHALGAALEAMTPPITLIAGGYDNGENYNGLLELLKTKVRVGIFYGETRVHLYPLSKQVVIDSYMVENLEEALGLAITDSKKFGIATILYSPGAKSFDQYDNVYDRISHLEKLIQQYKK